VSLGTSHACGVASGTIRCWGSNSDGRLGNGGTSPSDEPVAVTSLGSANSQVSAGVNHTCAVTSAGRVACWGSNSAGQLGTPIGGSSATPVTAIASGAAEVRAGSSFSCARMTSGIVRCWGSNTFGQLGSGGTGGGSEPRDVLNLNGVTSLALGVGSHACALRSDRTVWCWGRNSSGQLGNGSNDDQTRPVQVSGLSDAMQISVGAVHSCATRASGAVVCWGNNNNGRLGDGGTTSQPRPVMADVTSAQTVATGLDHTCVVRADGGVRCWGNNVLGQLGVGDTAPRTSPVSVLAP